MNKSTIVSIMVAILATGGVLIMFSKSTTSPVVNDNTVNSTTSVSTTTNIEIKTTITVSDNVKIVNGVQIISLQVKGGYSPQQTMAQASIPTVLRFTTDNTFDCSRSLRLVSLNISKVLPQSGDTDIDIGKPVAGLFRGTCGMGMYSFQIEFK